MRNKIRKKAYGDLLKLDSDRENVYIIHYSCGHFIEISDGYSPRINSIAIHNLQSGQTTSFAIHRIAEIEHITKENIEFNYDRLEKMMLDEYYKFVKEHQSCKWIHWNMRDSNFGFKALEHRYRVLGGEPVYITDNNKYDLSKIFNEIYGEKYIEHPKMENILRLNNISMKGFMSGLDEASAFKQKEFSRIYQSSLRKVYEFSKLFELALNKELKTKSTWKDQYGLSIQGIYEYCTSNFYIMFIWQIVSIILGAWVSSLFT